MATLAYDTASDTDSEASGVRAPAPLPPKPEVSRPYLDEVLHAQREQKRGDDTDSESSDGGKERASLVEVHRACPYTSVTPCVLKRQALSAELQRLRTEVELHAGRYTTDELEDMKVKIDDVAADIRLHSMWQAQLNKEKFASHKKALPITGVAGKIRAHLADNRVLLVTGSTGSGKSTQVPQIVYEMISDKTYTGSRKPILVAQTRRIASTSVAARVAVERGEVLGNTVGFTIGGLNAFSRRKTKVHFVTVGVLLAMLTSGNFLRAYSHVIIDEVHERTLEIDASLSMLKAIMVARNTRLRLIVMSATLDSFRAQMQRYFKEVNFVLPPGPPVQGAARPEQRPVPVVTTTQSLNYSVHYIDSIPCGDRELHHAARRHPKRARIPRERMQLGTELVLSLHAGGLDDASNILVFLPGLADIAELTARLESSPGLTDSALVVQMHSTVSLEDQYRVFQDHDGKRVIVLATNVAESALTIKNLGVVIDFCLHKETVFDSDLNISSLELRWACKNMCQQRAGRCGRVFAGQVFRMVTQAEYEAFDESQIPEILCTPLQTLCLRVLAMRWTSSSVVAFLQDFIDPPAGQSAILRALNDLVDMQICAKGESSVVDLASTEPCIYELTYFGKLVSLFTIDVYSAMLVVYGAMFGCFTDSVVIAAARSKGGRVVLTPHRQPVLSSMLDVCFAGPSLSDDVATANAYHFWRKRRGEFLTKHKAQRPKGSTGSTFLAEKEWCASKGLSLPALRDLHDKVVQVQIAASKAGLCEPPMSAEKGRQLEERLHSLEVLAATEVDDTAALQFAPGDPIEAACDRIADLLVSLTIDALDDERDKKIEKTTQQAAIEKAYARNHEALVDWIMQDSFREVEPMCLRSADQFRITACLFATHLHHSFVVGHSPSCGADPLNSTEGSVAPFYLSLGLSHRFACPDGDDTPETLAAKSHVEDQLRVVRHNISADILSKTEKRIHGEPLLPLRYTVFRPGMQRVELFLRSSARGARSDAGWFAQSGLNTYFNLRIACRLQDRVLRVPPALQVEEAVRTAKRGRDGTLRLPGKKAHSYLSGNSVAVSSAAPHTSVAAAGVLVFSPPAAKMVRVVPRMCSVAFPMLLPKRGIMGFGVGTSLSGSRRQAAAFSSQPGKMSRVSMEAGTVLLGCPGVAELVVLLMDPSVKVLGVGGEVVHEMGGTHRTVRDVRFSSSRNGVKKQATLRCVTDTLRTVANVRELGARKLAQLHVKYVNFVKSAHKKLKERVADLPDFDMARVVKNTWANPLGEFVGLPPATMPSDTPEQMVEADGGVITEASGGFVGLDNEGDPELNDRLVREAMFELSAAVEPQSCVITVPYPTETLSSG